jgi:ribose-phosphate pyrophosphokinase
MFGLSETRALAERIASGLGVPLARHEERDFDDGEVKIRALDEVAGHDVVVCQSLCGDATRSVHDKLCRLLFFCAALREAGASEVTAVVPYFAYARKDKRTKWQDPVTSRYVAQLLEAVGIDAVVTLEPHNASALDNALRCRKQLLEAAPAFAGHFARRVGAAPKIVAVSPDAGGLKRARRFAELLAQALGRTVGAAFVEKERSEGRVTGELFAGDVRGAVAIVYDDLIGSGGTIARAAEACRAHGAAAVHAAAAHGVLSETAGATLAAAGLESLALGDSVADVERRCGPLASVAIVPCAPLFVAALRASLGAGGATSLNP